jgi:capsular exopolysaccharide synthesis family protein
LRTLLVTSPGAGEGKSTVASNLAIVFAQAGRRTLLIDADLRRPRQHAIFGGRRKPGLTDVAILGTPLDTGLHRIAPATADPSGSGPARLDALFAGTAPPSPVDFLNSTTLGALLDRLVDGYDCVIIDTPPVLVSADAVVLAARVDGVVIVARMGKTDWRALTEARRLLGQAGARVLGTVANELSVARGYGYARYRYHRYHYGYQHAAAH